jgi:4-hydroxybenzoate polyprenyltransferase
MFERVRKILEMIRFSHTLFALPFALLAAVMAWACPVLPPGANRGDTLQAAPGFRWSQLLGLLVCMVFARSAAMAFNRVADRRIDADNPRTKSRHLVTGSLSVSSVIAFTAVCSLGFVASTLLFLPNRLPLYLSVPVLVLLLGYSYAKRITALTHVWLGAALMAAPVSAWIAIRGEQIMDQPADLIPALVLGLGVLLWVTGFDIIYACQDTDFDLQAKLRSVPVVFGVDGALRLAAACHAAMVAVLMSLPWLCPQLGLGWIYVTGIAGVGVLLFYEHWIVRPDDLTRVNIAFFHVNAIVSVGLFVVGTLDLLI